MRKVFDVEMASENGCTQMTFPATPYAMLDALEKLELAEGEIPRWEMLRTHEAGRAFQHLDQENGSLAELNVLAQRLARLDKSELAIFKGLAVMEKQPLTQPFPLPRLIDLAYSTDCCYIVEEAVSDDTLGRFCANNGFVPEADGLTDQQFELLDFARIGREFRQNEGGVFISGGYVQRHDELKQVYKTLDITLKKPDYTMLVELSDGSRAKLPAPPGKTVVEESARCVDCAAPALIGLAAMRSTMDMLARRLSELELYGELPKYKAVLEAAGCDGISKALTLADDLGRYSFDPELRERDEVAINHLKELLPEKDLANLLPNVNLYCYGQKMMEESCGKLTGYGYVQPLSAPVQTMNQEPVQGGMEMM